MVHFSIGNLVSWMRMNARANGPLNRAKLLVKEFKTQEPGCKPPAVLVSSLGYFRFSQKNRDNVASTHHFPCCQGRGEGEAEWVHQHEHPINELKEELRKLVHLITDKDDCRIEVFDQLSNTLSVLKDLKFNNKQCTDESVPALATSLSQQLDTITVPDYFLCPISSELMRDPVMLATGQTYDRPYIQAWLDADHRTCPKTQQVLPHLILTPNYLVRSMIEQWCESRGLEPPMRTPNTRTRVEVVISQERKYARILLDKLSGDHESEQREAARELRALTRKKANLRAFIGEAGAISVLVPFLLSPDSETQEHVVTTLLNLSIHNANKSLIVEEGGIEPIVEVLRKGSMAARENAAAALFSLSAVDENKVRIGASDNAIPGLVDLLREGSSGGKKDAASALFNLCICSANRAKCVKAGVVAVLLRLIEDESQGMADESLVILAILSSHREGVKAIGQGGGLSMLMDFMKQSSPHNQENAVVILLALCAYESSYMRDVRNNDVGEGYMALVDLSLTGTSRARRKANDLLDRMKKQDHLELETHTPLTLSQGYT
eukprot:Gb_24091 [translate_table: standard]